MEERKIKAEDMKRGARKQYDEVAEHLKKEKYLVSDTWSNSIMSTLGSIQDYTVERFNYARDTFHVYVVDPIVEAFQNLKCKIHSKYEEYKR